LAQASISSQLFADARQLRSSCEIIEQVMLQPMAAIAQADFMFLQTTLHEAAFGLDAGSVGREEALGCAAGWSGAAAGFPPAHALTEAQPVAAFRHSRRDSGRDGQLFAQPSASAGHAVAMCMHRSTHAEISPEVEGAKAAFPLSAESRQDAERRSKPVVIATVVVLIQAPVQLALAGE
jgi:hypothetical protein